MDITLRVPESFKLPEWFATASPEEVSDALRAIPNIFHHIKTLRSQEEFADLKDTVQATSTAITTELGRSLQPLHLALSGVSTELSTLRNNGQEASTLVADARGVLDNVRCKIFEKLGELHAKKDETRDLNVELHRDIGSLSANMDVKMDQITERIAKTVEMSMALASEKRNNITSSEKGRQGEEYFDAVVRESPGLHTWDVEDTSGCTGRGDRLCSDGRDFKVMVELKNNEKRLNSKTDIDKFTRDARSCLSEGYCDAALLISLKTKSIQDRGAVYLEYINKKPVVWLCSDSQATITAVLVILRGIAIKTKREQLNVPDLSIQDRTAISDMAQKFIVFLLTNQDRATELQKSAEKTLAIVNDIKLDIQEAINANDRFLQHLSFGEEIESSFFAKILDWFTEFYETNKKHCVNKKKVAPDISALQKRTNNSFDDMKAHVSKRLRLDEM